MNISTSDPSLDFPKQMTLGILNVLEEGEKGGYRMVWKFILDLISQHTLYVISILVIVFMIAFLDYKFTGKWRSLGRVLYNYFYFGTLFIVTLIFGPEMFANPFMALGTLAVYFLCYHVLVRKALIGLGVSINDTRPTGFRRYYRKRR